MVGEENAEKLKISLESDFIINCLPTEGDLANKHHIGITPTREALIVLTHDKLLEALPRTGYIVKKNYDKGHFGGFSSTNSLRG